MDEKKERKRNRFLNPWLWDPQYRKTGSEKEKVLTGCPCGGRCLSTGLRVEVCVYVSVMLTENAEARPTAPVVADIQWSVSLKCGR